MSVPIVMGDKVQGQCMTHMIPNPSSGAPQPAGPLPFSAPLTLGLAQKTYVGGKPVALLGASGYNAPPHVGLHPSDPFMTPTLQVGRVVSGSMSIFVEGKPMALQSSAALCCVEPGNLIPTTQGVTAE